MGDRSSSLWASPAESSARLSAAVADAAGAAETAGHLLRPMKRVSGVARLLRSSSVAHTSSRHNSRSEQGLQRRAALSLSRHFLALLLCFATCFSLRHCEVSCKKVCCCTIQQAESLPAIKMLPGNEWMCLRIKRLGFQKTCGAV